MSIPRILHYCWFGTGQQSIIEKKCMESWKKFFQDFAIMKWNENNFDIECNPYVHEAYEAKKYMYVSDYARIKALYEFGGLYLDTDCKIHKDLSPLLSSNQAFTGFGCDNKELMAGVMAFEPKNTFLLKLLKSYENAHFINSDGSYDMQSINIRMTNLLSEYGFKPNGIEQEINGIHIYPMTYFCPWSLSRDTAPDCFSSNTYIEHVWKSKEFRREHKWYIKFGRKMGIDKVKRRLLRKGKPNN